VQKAREGIDRIKLYPVAEAVKLVRERATTKFDETVEIAMNLGSTPSMPIRWCAGWSIFRMEPGAILRVAVFARGAKADEATAAGADIVGAEDLVATVQGGTIAFDRCIATPT